MEIKVWTGKSVRRKDESNKTLTSSRSTDEGREERNRVKVNGLFYSKAAY